MYIEKSPLSSRKSIKRASTDRAEDGSSKEDGVVVVPVGFASGFVGKSHFVQLHEVTEHVHKRCPVYTSVVFWASISTHTETHTHV